MFKNKSWSSKAAVTLLAGAVALTGLGLETALAAPKAAAKAQTAQPQEITDFSARRRGKGYYNNNAAAIGTFLAIAGTVAAVAAARRHRHRPYGYYGGGYPGYYAPRYYAPQPYYGGGPNGYYGRPYRYW